mmetsp:Transcript_36235/g.112716  ORF Transcript_36235/g.112716 Transcript_36235/m.112716 type:complete len:251 (+) Transcript_36235:1661-2413(+)
MVKLQRGEVHAGEPVAHDLHRVQVVQREQGRVARRPHDLHAVVYVLRVRHGDGADVVRVVLRASVPGADSERRLLHTLHLLRGHGSPADLMEVLPKGHLSNRQLLAQQAVACARAAIAELLPVVEDKYVALITLGRADLGAEHVDHTHGLHLASLCHPELHATLLQLHLLPEILDALPALVLLPISSLDAVLAQPRLQHLAAGQLRLALQLSAALQGLRQIEFTKLLRIQAAPPLPPGLGFGLAVSICNR